jgi:hypothetical protein
MCYCCFCCCCRESVAINSSLMTLARCLEVLRYNQQHPGDEKVIPYRESKVRSARVPVIICVLSLVLQAMHRQYVYSQGQL